MAAEAGSRLTGIVDPRLRAAVDASVGWYDDVFALHGIPVRREGGLWSALRPPPPWHSAVKTLEPGVETERVVRSLAELGHGGVADSFGDLELEARGFELLIDAHWVHREPPPESREGLPDGWSVLRTAPELMAWAAAHDYTDVLPPVVLDHPRFKILAHRRAGALVGGAVTHDGGGALGLSNVWGVETGPPWADLLAAVAALHPGRDVTDYAQGVELDAMLTAGFTPVGPQRVWVL
jgi:hypothetical protein